jgi:signal transduction histidine kinase
VERYSRTDIVSKIAGLIVLWGGAVGYKYAPFPLSIAGILLVAVGSALLMIRARTTESAPSPTAPQPEDLAERPAVSRGTSANLAGRSANDLLEHVPFVALSVGPDLTVGLGGASKHAERLLAAGDSIVGRDFIDLMLLGDDSGETGTVLREWFQLIFEKPDQDWDTVLELCPLDTITIDAPDGSGPTEFRLRYHPMRAGEGGPVVRVLVVGTDVTEERALAKELETREKDGETSVKRFAEVLKLGAETFRRFLNECQTRIAEASGAIEALEKKADDTEALRTLLRQIHTLKANARALRLQWIASSATDTEDALADLRDNARPGEHPALETALVRLESLRQVIDDTEVLGTEVFGRSLDPGEVRSRERDLEVPVRVGRLETIIAMIRAAKAVSTPTVPQAGSLLKKAEASLDTLRNVPARNLFQRFPKMVADLAAVMGKKLNPLRVNGSDTMLNVRMLDRVGDALVHLLRNAIAHGIEPTETRLSSDKPESGTIELSLTHVNETFVFEVKDDGAGVNYDDIRAAAVHSGLASEEESSSMPEDQLRALVFKPGFSTLSSPNDTAGRGIGLDMVAAAAQFLGGDVGFDTKPGAGTTIRLTVPDKWPC